MAVGYLRIGDLETLGEGAGGHGQHRQGCGEVHCICGEDEGDVERRNEE